MNKCKVVFFVFLLIGTSAVVYNFAFKAKRKSTLGPTQIENVFSNRKSRFRNHFVFKALEMKDFDSLKERLLSKNSQKANESLRVLESEKKLLDSYTNNELQIIEEILQKKVEEQKAPLAAFRVLAYIYHGIDHKSSYSADYEKHILGDKKLSFDKKSIYIKASIRSGKVPDSIFKFLLKLAKNNSSDIAIEIVLFNMSFISEPQKISSLFAALNVNKDKFSDLLLRKFLKVSLFNRKVLSLEQGYFEPVVKKNSNNIKWQELTLHFYKEFSLELEKKEEILLIAKGNNSRWVKNFARKILENTE